jgi:hypothetical protein
VKLKAMDGKRLTCWTSGVKMVKIMKIEKMTFCIPACELSGCQKENPTNKAQAVHSPSFPMM